MKINRFLKKHHKSFVMGVLFILALLACSIFFNNKVNKMNLNLMSDIETVKSNSNNFPTNDEINTRSDLINYLIETNKLETYLEIGLNNPFNNFTKINCKDKTSVDPYFPHGKDNNTEENLEKWLEYCTHRMTSDDFFNQNQKKFDIIFIDGLHHEDQVDKDLRNALACLKNDGFIVVHDCLPPTEDHQKVPRLEGAWNGTVWKSFVKISGIKDGSIQTFMLNADWGCGVIKKLKEVSYPPFAPLEMSWKDFFENRYNLYNMVQPCEYKKIS